jgi:glucan phosphorylase
MKFALAGAFTIGTLDSANVAIREEVGAENLLLLGLTAEQARELKLRGCRQGESPKKASLPEILHFVGSDALAGGNRNLFRPFLDRSLYEDAFLVLADYQATWTARRGSVPYGATRGRGPAKQSSTWRVWVSSHPTAPSVPVWRVKRVKGPSSSTVERTRDARGHQKRVS